MLITLGLSVLLTLTANQFAIQGTAELPADKLHTAIRALGISLAGLSFFGSLLWTLERRKLATLAAGLVALWSTLGVIVLSLAGRPFSLSLPLLAEALTSAWLMGSVTAAMLLGHWYLTATGMPLIPFKQYNLIAGCAAVLRCACVLCLPAAAGSWPLQLLRWAGLLGPLLLTILTWRVLRYRNTQSATGVLYAATILVFMGEMAAALMARMQD
ncbi:hypothetical protein [Planctomicrobium sp. SH664]|uniref:hypothetical protein n=1 Tax=Planctomicrobium sp. SH664 TaxID=3448125 RepID=UPI003F5B03D3